MVRGVCGAPTCGASPHTDTTGGSCRRVGVHPPVAACAAWTPAVPSTGTMLSFSSDWGCQGPAHVPRGRGAGFCASAFARCGAAVVTRRPWGCARGPCAAHSSTMPSLEAVIAGLGRRAAGNARQRSAVFLSCLWAACHAVCPIDLLRLKWQPQALTAWVFGLLAPLNQCYGQSKPCVAVSRAKERS